MTGPVGGFAPVRPVPVAGTDLFDWKGTVHCHSYLSHDSEGTVEEIAAAAAFARLDFLIMTDHQTDASVANGVRGRIGDTLFVVGAEIRTPQGSVIAFPLERPLRRWMSAGALAAEARQQGAIALICHAEGWRDWNVDGLAGVELVNLHAGAKARSPVALVLTALLLPVRFVMLRIARPDREVVARWDERLQTQHPLAPVGGGDAHANIRVFGPLGGTIADYPEVFLTLSTHVLAERCDEASIVAAIQAGRTYVSFDLRQEGHGFDFRATDAEGVHLPGATVTGSPSLCLSVRTPAPGQITLLRDGRPVRSADGDALELPAPPPGIYRVEVRTIRGGPWLFSSTIRVVEP